jgi:hypothetical protein
MAPPLVFGVFPLGMSGSADGLATGPPDDFEQVSTALSVLAGDGPPVLPRMYVGYSGPAGLDRARAGARRIASSKRAWDLALCYRDPGSNLDGWADFVGGVVTDHGDRLAAVQVTSEANLAASRPPPTATTRMRPRP